MYPHSLPPEAQVMRRRVHDHACVWPVVPDVCPWPMRFQCCPALDLTAPPASAQRPPAEPVSLSPVALAALVGRMPYPHSYFHGCATTATVSAAAGRKPMHLLTPELEIWTLPCGLRAVFDSYREMVSLDTEAP